MTSFKDQFKLPNIVKICSNCGKEHNIDTNKLESAGWAPSHGLCIRHFISLMKQIGLNDESIQSKIEKLRDIPCVDLDDEKNKPLLNWLLNPTPKDNK